MSRLPSMWTTTKPIKPTPVSAIKYFAPRDERHGRSNTFINALSVEPPGPCESRQPLPLFIGISPRGARGGFGSFGPQRRLARTAAGAFSGWHVHRILGGHVGHGQVS